MSQFLRRLPDAERIITGRDPSAPRTARRPAFYLPPGRSEVAATLGGVDRPGAMYLPPGQAEIEARKRFERVSPVQQALALPDVPTRSAGEVVSDTLGDLGSGAVGASTALTDLFGAGNPASTTLRGWREDIQGAQSPGRKAELARQAVEAQNLGPEASFGSRLSLKAQQALRSPLATVAEGAGNIVPLALAGAAAAPLGLGAGAVALGTGILTGLGAIKGQIFDTINQADDAQLMGDPEYAAARAAGTSEAQAKADMASKLQSYAENPGKIAAGGVLGAIAGRFGADKAIAGLASAGGRNLVRDILEKQAGSSILKSALVGAGKEAWTEGLQEGGEQYLGNLGAARGGATIDPMSGVPESVAAAAIMSAVPGAGSHVVEGLNARRDLAAMNQQEQATAQEQGRLEGAPPGRKGIEDSSPFPQIAQAASGAPFEDALQPAADPWAGAEARRAFGMDAAAQAPVVPATAEPAPFRYGERPAPPPAAPSALDAALRNLGVRPGAESLAILGEADRLNSIAPILNANPPLAKTPGEARRLLKAHRNNPVTAVSAVQPDVQMNPYNMLDALTPKERAAGPSPEAVAANEEARAAAQRALEDQAARDVLARILGPQVQAEAERQTLGVPPPGPQIPGVSPVAVESAKGEGLVAPVVRGEMAEPAMQLARPGEAFDQRPGPIVQGERVTPGPVGQEAPRVAERVNPVGRPEEVLPTAQARPIVGAPGVPPEVRGATADAGKAGEVQSKEIVPPSTSSANVDFLAALPEVKRQTVDVDAQRLRQELEPLAKTTGGQKVPQVGIHDAVGRVLWDDLRKYLPVGTTIKDIPQRLRRILTTDKKAPKLDQWAHENGEEWGFNSPHDVVEKLMSQDVYPHPAGVSGNGAQPIAQETFNARDIAARAGLTALQAHDALAKTGLAEMAKAIETARAEAKAAKPGGAKRKRLLRKAKDLTAEYQAKEGTYSANEAAIKRALVEDDPYRSQEQAERHMDQRKEPDLRAPVGQFIEDHPAATREQIAAEVKRLRAELNTDPLTGLGSRRAMEESEKTTKAIASIDASGLKWWNDTFGHEAGDRLLKGIGNALRVAMGEFSGASAFRPGGDEYAVHGKDADTVSRVVNRANELLNEALFNVTKKDGSNVTYKGVSIDFGIAENFQDADRELLAGREEKQREGLRAERGAQPSGVVEVDRTGRPIDRNNVAEGDATPRAEVAAPPDTAREAARVEPPIKAEIAKAPALFVQIGDRRFEVADFKDASERWQGFHDAAFEKGATGATLPKPIVVDQDGKEVARIAQNGKVFPPAADWRAEVGQTPLYDPSAATPIAPEPAPRKAVSTEKTKAGTQVLLPGAEGMMATTGKVGALKRGQEDVNRGPLFTQDEEAEKKADAAKQRTLDEAPVDTAAAEAEKPKSEAQADAGNYKKGHVRIAGLDVSIENEAGSKRRPEWPTLKSHYGYVKGTESKDGEHIDAFIAPGTPADYSGPVFVINQTNEKGVFDEHKAMIGWPTETDALKAYLENYTRGWDRFSGVSDFTDAAEFKQWSENADTTKPAPLSFESKKRNADREAIKTADTKRSEQKPEPKREGKIDDIGEKMGGARKDLATKTGPKGPKAEDERPAWAKRFVVSQTVSSSDPLEKGKWVVSDSKKTDRFHFQALGTFETKEQAEAFVPIAAVGASHRVYKGGDGRFKIERQIGERKLVQVVKETFETREDAMAYMAAHAEEILDVKTNFGEEVLPRPDPNNVQRIGEARRKGNVTSKQFEDIFGFRGVEFGNWNAQDERQTVMNHAYDSLLDLAETLGIPPKAISLNGDLGLAFGARGHGLTGARAHYEPDYGVINLTKMKGAGALAHEWFHSLDHYFYRQDYGEAGSKRVPNLRGDLVFKHRNMASEGFVGNVTRPEVKAKLKTLISTMKDKAEKYVEDTKRVEKWVGQTRDDVKHQLDQIRNNVAATATWGKKKAPASPEQLARFDALAEQLLNGEAISLEWKEGKAPRSRFSMGSGRYTNAALEEISDILQKVRGYGGFAKDTGPLRQLASDLKRYHERIVQAKSAETGEEKTRSVPTQFAMNARSADQGRVGAYWSTNPEMAARAFQSYVEDRLSDDGAQNDFLTFGTKNAVVVTPWGFVRPYPLGEERAALNAAFDDLFKTIQSKETDKGVALYANRPEGVEGPKVDLAAVKREFSNSEVRELGPGAFEVKDGQRTVHIRVDDEGLSGTVDPAAFKSAYGRDFDPQRDGIVGAWQQMPRGGVMWLAKSADSPILRHERFHYEKGKAPGTESFPARLARAFGFGAKMALTDAERTALYNRFEGQAKTDHEKRNPGAWADMTREQREKVVEEYQADAYAQWRPEQKADTLFGKIQRFAQRAWRAFRPSWESAFQRVSEGETAEGQRNRVEDQARFASMEDGTVRKFTPKGSVGTVSVALSDRGGTGPIGLTPNGMLLIDGTVFRPTDPAYLWEGKFYKEPPAGLVEETKRNLDAYIENMTRLSSQIDRSVAKGSPTDVAREKEIERRARASNDPFLHWFDSPETADVVKPSGWEKKRYPWIRDKYSSDLREAEEIDSISPTHDPKAISDYFIKKKLGAPTFSYLHVDGPQNEAQKNALRLYENNGGKLGKTALDAMGAKYVDPSSDSDEGPSNTRYAAVARADNPSTARRPDDERKPPTLKPGSMREIPMKPMEVNDVAERVMKAAEENGTPDNTPLEDLIPPDFPRNMRVVLKSMPEEDAKRVARYYAAFSEENQVARREISWETADKQALKLMNIHTRDQFMKMARSGVVFNEPMLRAATRYLYEDMAANEQARETWLRARAAGAGKDSQEYADFVAASLQMAGSMMTMRGEQAEAARAFNARKDLKVARTPSEKLIGSLFRRVGGLTPEQTAEVIRISETEPHMLPDTLRSMQKPGFWDYVNEYRKSAMLFSPRTYGVNFFGNAMKQAMTLAEIPVAAAIDKARAGTAGERQVYAGEVGAALAALASHGPAALKRFAAASLDALKGVENYDPNDSRPMDYQIGVIPGPAGKIVRTTFRLLNAADDFFKETAGRQSLYREAYRRARKEGLTGQNATNRVDQLVGIYDSTGGADRQVAGMKERAISAAEYDTFTKRANWENSGAFGLIANLVGQAEKKVGALGLIVPFKGTPANIAYQGYERSPFAFAPFGLGAVQNRWSELRGLQKQLQADPHNSALISEINAKAEEAVNQTARALIGTTLFLTAAAAAALGNITGAGPADPDERKLWQDSGNLPTAVRIGDSEWYAYDRFEPVAASVALAANFPQMMKEKTVGKQVAAFMNGIQDAWVSKTYLQGLLGFADILSDPARYGEKWLRDLEGSFVPASAAQLAEQVDPVVRDNTGGGLDAVRARIPGLSADLPARRTGTGEPATRTERLGGRGPLNIFGFIRTGSAEGDPLAKEFLDADYQPTPHKKTISVGIGPKGMKKRVDLELSPAELDLFRKADLRVTARLRRLIAKPGWRDLDSEVKKAQFRRIYDSASNAVREVVLPRALARFQTRRAAELAAQPGGGA